MTVQKLIEKLKSYPGEARLVTTGADMHRFDTVTGVHCLTTGLTKITMVVIIDHRHATVPRFQQRS